MFARQSYVVYEMIQVPGDLYKEIVGCEFSLENAIEACRRHTETHGRFGEYEVYTGRKRVWVGHHSINEFSREDCLVAGRRY